MTYDPSRDYLEATVLLKQGLYDYCFAMAEPKSGTADATIFEGSYYETVNEYAIFVYYHDSRIRYDRLLGYLPVK